MKYTDIKLEIEGENTPELSKIFNQKIDFKYNEMIKNKKRQKEKKVLARKNKKKLTKHFHNK